MIHEVVEGRQYQSADEIISYQVTTTNWVSVPTSPAVVVFDETTEMNVTTTVMPTNSPSVNGDIITLSPLKLLSAGHVYRVEVKFTVGGNVYECFFLVQCDW